MAEMKKDNFLDNAAADELSRRITDERLRQSGVDFSKLADDPDLRPVVEAAEASKKKRKAPKLSISKAEVKKLAGY
jgi:hypothetical protein